MSGVGFTAYSEAARRASVDAVLPMLVLDGVDSALSFHPQCASECYGYHVGWLLLQSLHLISGLDSEREEMVRNLQRQNEECRISSLLIAGAADFGILSVVHEALGSDIKAARISVLDRCETPLALCEFYAARMGFSVEVIHADVSDCQERGGFDLILGHSILSFVAPDRRQAFIRVMASQLAPLGRLVLYQSIRPAPENGLLRFGQEETLRWISDAGAAWESAGGRFSWLPKERLEYIVAEFCRVKRTYAVASVDALSSMFAAAGLDAEARKLFDSRTRHKAATPKSAFAKYVISGGHADPVSCPDQFA